MIARLFGALSDQVRRADIEWRTENEFRRSVQFSFIHRRLIRAAEHPLRSSILLFVLFLLLSIFVSLSPIPRFPLIRLTIDDSTALSYLSTIWGIQATILALVYPIVIAFVTLLIQRLHQGQSVLHIYLHDSAAALSGFSAIMLLLLMGIQYLSSPLTNTIVVLNWALISGLWFILNVVLATFFLFRTIAFIHPDRRTTTVKNYALNVAWPAEVNRHLRVHIFDNSVHNDLLPGPAYPPQTDQPAPSIWMGSSGTMATDVRTVVSRTFKTETALGDVFFRPLALAISSWLRRAEQQISNSPPHTSPLVLIFPIHPDIPLNAETTLCCQRGMLPLSRKEQLLIRLSFFFRSKHRDLDLTIEKMFDDLKREAISAMQSSDSQVYSSVLRNAMNLLVSIIKASSFKNSTERLDNFTQLSHRLNVFGRPIYEQWTRMWIDLFRESSKEIASDDQYFGQLVYVAPSLFTELNGIATKRILYHVIDLQPVLLSRLGEWWVRTLEQQGTMEHDPCNMASIAPPYSSTYESLVRKFVGAWESLKNERILGRGLEAQGWRYFQDIGKTFERHLHLSVTMACESVYRGDTTASVWISDLLLKWISELDFYFESGLHFTQRDKWITFEVVECDWETLKTELNIETLEDVMGQANLKKSALSVALRNYWTDACCILAYHLAIWGRVCDCQTSLPALLIRSLLHGQSLVGGHHSANAISPILNADELFFSILRQRHIDGGYSRGYRARLSRLVRRLASIDAEVMVPGRVYTGVGVDDLDSIQDGQLALLLLVVPENWTPSEGTERLLREWLRTDDDTLRSLDSDLNQWKSRLENPSIQEYRSIFDCLMKDSERTFDDALTSLAESIEGLLARIEVMRTEALEQIEVSEARLREIGAWASETGFSRQTGAFPLPLLGLLQTIPDQEFHQRSCILPKVNKGEYTEPPMAQRPVNEEEFFARTIRSYVGINLLRDVLQQIELQDVQAPSPVRYWEHVIAYSERARNEDHRPILLLENRTRPDWVYDWLHQYRESFEIPENLEVWHDPQASSDAYIANLNDVAVYLAPTLSPGTSILMTRESLGSVAFSDYPTGEKVIVESEPIGGETSIINLKLSWAFSLEVGQYPCLRLMYEHGTDSTS